MLLNLIITSAIIINIILTEAVLITAVVNCVCGNQKGGCYGKHPEFRCGDCCGCMPAQLSGRENEKEVEL